MLPRVYPGYTLDLIPTHPSTLPCMTIPAALLSDIRIGKIKVKDPSSVFALMKNNNANNTTDLLQRAK